MKRQLAILGFFLLAGNGLLLAQEGPLHDSLVTLSFHNIPLREALSIISARTQLRFDYNPELVSHQKKVSLAAVEMPLTKLLDALFSGTGLSYTVIGHGIVIRKQEEDRKVTLSGYIRDGETTEWLIGASVFLPDLKVGTVTNLYGFYSITVPATDTLRVEVSYIGYEEKMERINGRRDVDLTINLGHSAAAEQIPQLTLVRDSREDNVKRNQLSVVDLPAEMLTSAPSTGSPGDLIYSLELLPGVQAGLEGTTGYSVRGGNTGQNIVLLDEARIYNPSHLFGLVSIFNPEAVKYARLLKGGFPASYGDHLSSVLDVSMKDGNNHAFGGSVQGGNIASGLSLYGPLGGERSSFFVAARRSLLDLWLPPLSPHNYFDHYNFYDVNGKLNFHLTGKDRLFISFYKGRDRNDYSRDSAENGGINYNMYFGNVAFSLRWNHQFSGKLFSNTSLVYNHYQQFLSATQQGYFAQLYSGIRDLNAKADFSWYPHPAHKIKAGADFLYQTLFPASISDNLSNYNSYVLINPADIPQKNSLQSTLYAGDDILLGEHFGVNLGVRAPLYYTAQVQYLDIEPRLSLLYIVDGSTSIKASYSRMHQYIHLVQSYNASFPAEIWIGSSPVVQPQYSDEYSAGIFRNLKENAIQASLEFYYKGMGNQSLFKGASSPVIDNSIENKLIFGKAWSYGAEWMIRKISGRWKGWLAYSYAYAWQQFDSLNQGKAFPFALDRRQSLSISTSYMLSPHWKISAALFVTGGRAFTLSSKPVAGGSNGNPLYDDGGENDDGRPIPPAAQEPNNYRLTPYNRLDLGLAYHKSHVRHGTLWETSWTLAVYNVYARYNTGFVYRAIDPVTKQATATQVPFIPVIPSLTYSVSF